MRHARFRLDFLRIAITFLLVANLGLLAGCQASQPQAVTVGVINFSPALEPILEGFKGQLADLGYGTERPITYLYEGPAGSMENLDTVAQKLVAARPDLILALSTPAALAAQRATSTVKIPVIFVPVTDPVAAGVVESLGHPGGNLTGVTFGESDGRRLEWLQKVVPSLEHVYVPYNPEDGSPVAALRTVEVAAEKLGLTVHPQPVRSVDEIKQALERLPTETEAIFLLPDGLVVAQIAEFVRVAGEQQLPLSVPNAPQVEAGALLAYGFGFPTVGAQAARMADQVLEGVNPADLPVETAELFLTINVRTAEAIGLPLSDDILQQAHQIIR